MVRRLWRAVDRPRLVRPHPLASCRGRVLHALWNATPRRVRGAARELGSAAPAGAVAPVDATNAARPRRNREPQAWAQWPCDQVAAISAMGAARRRAEAGAFAPEDQISPLDPRAVFRREIAMTRAVARQPDRTELGVPTALLRGNRRALSHGHARSGLSQRYNV